MKDRRTFLSCAASAMGMTALYPCWAANASHRKKARFWEPAEKGVKCTLCPRSCTIKPGATGACRTRVNKGNSLYTIGYNNPCAINNDPVEKKPLYHVTPGARAYSIAIAGCNLRCKNCQNYTISQASPLETRNVFLTPRMVVEEAVKNRCRTIAYTYSEPVVWYEYMYDTAKLARAAGLKNLMITCGYINPAPLKELSAYIDAANIDLKSFSDDTYKKLNAGRLQPVLDTIKQCRESGMWVELTNLIVPKWSDNLDQIRAMCVWIRNNVGREVPLHFSRFHPLYKLAHLYPTPTNVMKKAKAIAREEGLHYVYIGNVAGVDSNTSCPKCKKPVVMRSGYVVAEIHIKDGRCTYCGRTIAGIWST